MSYKLTLALPGGALGLLGHALNNFPRKLRLKNFFRPMGSAGAPTAPPGYAYDTASVGMSAECQLTSLLGRRSLGPLRVAKGRLVTPPLTGHSRETGHQQRFWLDCQCWHLTTQKTMQGTDHHMRLRRGKQSTSKTKCPHIMKQRSLVLLRIAYHSAAMQLLVHFTTRCYYSWHRKRVVLYSVTLNSSKILQLSATFVNEFSDC